MQLKLLKPANTTLKVYPEDTPIFDRTAVSLQLPDRLFTSTFGTATNASKIIGNFIKNSARRFLYFSWFFKPLFGDALIVKDTRAIKLLNMTKTTTTTTMKPETSSEIDSLDTTTTMQSETSKEIDNLDTAMVQSETSSEIDNLDTTTLEPETTTVEENSTETTMGSLNLALDDSFNEV